MPQIRPALPSDAIEIAEFQTTCWREAYAGIVRPAYLERVGVPERTARWSDRIVTRSRDVALAELEGRVVGVVSWGTTPLAAVPPTELMSLYVAPAHRGRGLARDLLRHGVGQGPAHLWVFDANPRARAFYAKHDFRPEGRRAVDPDTGLDELLYVRR